MRLLGFLDSTLARLCRALPRASLFVVAQACGLDVCRHVAEQVQTAVVKPGQVTEALAVVCAMRGRGRAGGVVGEHCQWRKGL